MDGTADEYREALDAAHRHALAWLESTAERPIRPDLDAEGMLGRLRRELPEEGADAAAVVDELAEAAEPGLMAMGSPRVRTTQLSGEIRRFSRFTASGSCACGTNILAPGS